MPLIVSVKLDRSGVAMVLPSIKHGVGAGMDTRSIVVNYPTRGLIGNAKT